MIITLPQENWNDVFGFLARPHLAKIVPQIGNWYFALKAQYYLHECGNITLGRDLHISVNGNGPAIERTYLTYMPLADVPMPKNVKNFNDIQISYYDQSVHHFLQEFKHKSLFTNVNLVFYSAEYDTPPLLTFMVNVLPFFANISSIRIRNNHKSVHPFQFQYLQFAVPMLTSARVLIADYNSNNDWFCDWLTTPRDDGKPRILYLTRHDYFHPIHTFVEYIKKDFLGAKQAISFFAHLTISLVAYEKAPNHQPYSLENIQTKEKLVIAIDTKKKHEFCDWEYGLCISRHPLEANEEEWIKEMRNYSNTYPTIKMNFDFNHPDPKYYR